MLKSLFNNTRKLRLQPILAIQPAIVRRPFSSAPATHGSASAHNAEDTSLLGRAKQVTLKVKDNLIGKEDADFGGPPGPEFIEREEAEERVMISWLGLEPSVYLVARS